MDLVQNLRVFDMAAVAPYREWWADTAHVLLVAADMLDGTSRKWDGAQRREASAVMDKILTTAHCGGFASSDLLRQELNRGQLDGYSLGLLLGTVTVAGGVVTRDQWIGRAY